MAVKSGMFRSDGGDRKYTADFFASYFASFIGNGVFPQPSTGLQVVADTNMTVKLRPGKGWINGYYVINDSDLPLTHDTAGSNLPRIDAVVMKMDLTSRDISFYIKKGTMGSNPVAPTPTRDQEVYELILAHVYIGSGVTTITQMNITDTRTNSAICGIVAGVVDQIDATNLFAQYDSEFQNFMDNIIQTLGNDVAGELYNLINANTNSINGLTATVNNQGDEIDTLNTNLNNHINTAATTSVTGHVRLTTSDDSTSESLVPTANTLRKVNVTALEGKDGSGFYHSNVGWDGFTFNNSILKDGALTLDLDPTFETTNLPSSGSTITSQTINKGVIIITKKTMSSLNIYKFSQCNATTVNINNGSGTLVATGTFVGNKAVINHNFYNATTYYITTNGTSQYSVPFTGGVNITTNSNFNITNGAGSPAVPDTSYRYNIAALEVETNNKKTSGYAEKVYRSADLIRWGFVNFVRTLGGGSITCQIYSESNVLLKTITAPSDIGDIAVTNKAIKFRITLNRNNINAVSPTASKVGITYKGRHALFDETTGTAYALFVNNGTLGIREVQ